MIFLHDWQSNINSVCPRWTLCWVLFKISYSQPFHQNYLCITLHRDYDKRIGIQWIKTVYTFVLKNNFRTPYNGIIHYIDCVELAFVRRVLYWIINKIYRYNSVCNGLDWFHSIAHRFHWIRKDLNWFTAFVSYWTHIILKMSTFQSHFNSSTHQHTECVCDPFSIGKFSPIFFIFFFIWFYICMVIFVTHFTEFRKSIVSVDMALICSRLFVYFVYQFQNGNNTVWLNWNCRTGFISHACKTVLSTRIN